MSLELQAQLKRDNTERLSPFTSDGIMSPALVRLLRARRSLLLENLALRQQLAVLSWQAVYQIAVLKTA